MDKKKIISIIIVLLLSGGLFYIAYTQSDSKNPASSSSVPQVSGNDVSTSEEQNSSENTEEEEVQTEINETNIIGMDINDAASVLASENVVWDAKYEYHDDIPDGQIIEQITDENSNLLICIVNINQKELDEREAVAEHVNWLKENAVIMPNIYDTPLNDALQLLNETGGMEIADILIAEDIGMEYDENLEYVVSVMDKEHNLIAPGSYVTRGTEVYLVVCFPDGGNNE